MAKKRGNGGQRSQKALGDRVTYRELRNTPGRVWERLADDKPLTLVADGHARAILIPINDGDAAGAYDAYVRGRAMVAIREIQAEARRTGKDKMTLREINDVIRKVRSERARKAE
jgi:serine/threonine-protein kinase RIO1